MLKIDRLLVITFIMSFLGCQEPPVVAPEGSNSTASKAGSLGHYRQIEKASAAEIPVNCGTIELTIGDTIVTQKNLVRMMVINEKLKLLPVVQEALGITQVTTCAEAIAFTDYINEHPEHEDLFQPPQKSHGSNLHPISIDSALMGHTPPIPSPLKKTAIRDAAGSANRQGVVRITAINGTSVYCTGYMITLNALITAGHCVDDFITSGNTASATAIIQYYDPNSSNDPSNPRYVALFETVQIWLSPTYGGGTDAQSDIAVIRSNSNWYSTTIYDLVRFYNGTFADARYNVLWGQGYDSYAGTGLGVLRYENMYIEWYGAYHYYTLAYNHRVCRGDSGGPQFRDDIHGNFTLGHMSNVDVAMTGTKKCAKQGGKQRSNRVGAKLDWVEQVLETPCYNLTAYIDGTPYRQCFSSW